MTTKQGILSWDSLFLHGKPRNDIEKLVQEELVPADGEISVGKIPGVVILYDKKSNHVIKTSASSKDVRTSLGGIKKSLNGSARDYRLAIVQLPSGKKTYDQVVSMITNLYQKSRHHSAVGQKIYERLTVSHFKKGYVLMTNIMTHVEFRTIAKTRKGSLNLDRIPCAHDASGVYFIREHAPGDPLGRIVYVGKSTGRIVGTIKDHFREWKGKANETYEQSRGETRGDWLGKLKKGYHYEVGFIIMACPDHLKKHEFNTSILSIETMFIAVFNPRDNAMKRPTADADHGLFPLQEASPVIEESTAPNNERNGGDEDDLPF